MFLSQVIKNISLAFLFINLSLLASCANEETVIEDISVTKSPIKQMKVKDNLEYPAYTGYPRRIMVFPWNISKVDLEKYPHFRNLQIGFGISNRLLDELFSSGQFELIEEKQAVMARMLQQMQQCTTGLCSSDYAPMGRLPKPMYIVYPEVYHVGVEKNVSISGVSAKAKLKTEIGVQINFVDTRTGITRALGSAIGSYPNVLKSTILSNPKLEFSQSALGHAAEKAIKKALLKSMRNLPVLNTPPPPIKPVPAPAVYTVQNTKVTTNTVSQATTISAQVPSKVAVASSQNNQERNSGTLAATKKIPIDFLKSSNYRALIIGNNKYKHVDKLITAVNDAKVIADILEKNYNFETDVLIDATRLEVIAKLDELRKLVDKDDKLLIYYAGHGYFDEDADRGYWLPVNATTENTAEWISNTDITDKIKAMKSDHILVVSDSCYSGTLTRGLVIDIGSKETLSDYHARMMLTRSRTVMASGGLEPVADGGRDNHSVFAGAFIDALKANDKVMDGMALFNKVKREVTLNAEQTPEYSDIRFAGHKGGDFLFIRK